MDIPLIEHSAIVWTISLASITLCPTLCAVMAYRISRSYADMPLQPEPRKLTVVPMQIDEAAVNAAVKNLVF